MRLSLCIVGCGGYARDVLDKIRDMTEDLELYFASRDLSRAKGYCQAYGGAGFFGSYDEAIADPRVEAAYFFTPHHLHLENALMAARNSKHILIEKPIARTVEEAEEMIQAARGAGVKLMVAENFRFLPAVRKCKELIGQGSIGAVRLIQAHSEVYSQPTAWRMSAELTGGGVFIDGGIHYVDALVNLGGFPERVYAAIPPGTFPDVEGEDGLVMVCHLPDGAIGLINYSNGTPVTKNRQWIDITGTEGNLRFTAEGDELAVESSGARRVIQLPEARRGVPAMVKEFVDCIVEDREPLMSGEEGLKDLAVVLAAYRSAVEGREAPVELF